MCSAPNTTVRLNELTRNCVFERPDISSRYCQKQIPFSWPGVSERHREGPLLVRVLEWI